MAPYPSQRMTSRAPPMQHTPPTTAFALPAPFRPAQRDTRPNGVSLAAAPFPLLAFSAHLPPLARSFRHQRAARNHGAEAAPEHNARNVMSPPADDRQTSSDHCRIRGQNAATGLALKTSATPIGPGDHSAPRRLRVIVRKAWASFHRLLWTTGAFWCRRHGPQEQGYPRWRHAARCSTHPAQTHALRLNITRHPEGCAPLAQESPKDAWPRMR